MTKFQKILGVCIVILLEQPLQAAEDFLDEQFHRFHLPAILISHCENSWLEACVRESLSNRSTERLEREGIERLGSTEILNCPTQISVCFDKEGLHELSLIGPVTILDGMKILYSIILHESKQWIADRPFYNTMEENGFEEKHRFLEFMLSNHFKLFKQYEVVRDRMCEEGLQLDERTVHTFLFSFRPYLETDLILHLRRFSLFQEEGWIHPNFILKFEDFKNIIDGTLADLIYEIFERKVFQTYIETMIQRSRKTSPKKTERCVIS